jgi:hypothetical protein
MRKNYDGFAGERSSSGLIEFDALTDAVEALAVMNHYPIKSAGTYSTCIAIISQSKKS